MTQKNRKRRKRRKEKENSSKEIASIERKTEREKELKGRKKEQ